MKDFKLPVFKFPDTQAQRKDLRPSGQEAEAGTAGTRRQRCRHALLNTQHVPSLWDARTHWPTRTRMYTDLNVLIKPLECQEFITLDFVYPGCIFQSSFFHSFSVRIKSLKHNILV